MRLVVIIMLFISFDKLSKYNDLQFCIAIGILGVVFILLGWLISRIMRPSSKHIHLQIHDIKKELLDELNVAKKFNAEHQLYAKRYSAEPAKENGKLSNQYSKIAKES